MAYSEKYKRILHQLGYYDYQQGLIYRHLNQGEGWNNHLSNCRNFILKSLAVFKPSTVTVLGSGWLLDLPLKEIAEQTDRVNLIDIVHPPDAARQVSPLKNVILTEADVTGGLIEEVWEKAGRLPFFRRLKTLDDIIVPSFELPDDKGLIISLNILSQLETLPLKILKARSSAGEEEFLRLRCEIQQKHIDFLSAHNSVLITDISEIFIDKTRQETEVKSVIINLPEGESREEWTWDFDLRRSDYYEKNSVLKVVALILKS
jgi:hypothetical protein